MVKNNLIQRQYNLDYLRVFASIAIMFLHVTGQELYDIEVACTGWNIYNLCNGATRWGVPVFVMMSGALFLSREIPTKTLYTKYISRIAIAYVVWSAFYAIVDVIGSTLFLEGYHTTLVEIIGAFISGAVHLWFLPMIIGLYMCIPFIKQITQNDKLIKYFLILSIIFCFIKTQIELVTNNLLSGNAQIIFQNITTVFHNFNITIVMGFVAYFILGFHLNKTEISKKYRTIIYILGVVGVVFTILLTLMASKNAGKLSQAFYGASSVNVLLMSVAVFVWFKYNAKGSERLNKIIIHLSKYSFGAFLVHIFVLQVLSTIGFSSETIHPAFYAPATLVFTTVVSYLISMILNRIPVINKYIV